MNEKQREFGLKRKLEQNYIRRPKVAKVQARVQVHGVGMGPNSEHISY